MNAAEREAVRERLAALEDVGNGRLTPDAVVADARNPRSPLHAHFDWDDSSAAHRHRIDQARALITSVKVQIQTDTTTVVVAAYHRDPRLPGDEQGYVPTLRLRSEHDVGRMALLDAFEAAGNSLRRARELATALGFADDVEKLMQGVSDLRDLVHNEAGIGVESQG